MLHCYSKYRKPDKVSFMSSGRQIFSKHTHAFSHTPPHSEHTKTSSDGFLGQATGPPTYIFLIRSFILFL